MAELSFKNVSFRADHQEIISRINFSTKPGQITTVIGPNGAGKTTLLNLALGYYPPTNGEVFIDGKPLKSIPLYQRPTYISMLESDPSVAFETTVDDLLNISSNSNPDLKNYLVEKFAINTQWNVDRVSKGQQKRAFLAHTLLQNSKIILLDEPFANLDSRFKLELVLLIKEWAKKYGTNFLISLHDLELLLRLSDSTLILDSGKVAAYGETKKVILDRPFQEVFKVNIQEVESPSWFTIPLNQ